MKRFLHVRPSPAMVVACAALFVALSGVGYTAIVLPANSVGTKHLKKNAVTSAKVKGLLRSDFKPGQLPPRRFARVKSNGTLVSGTAKSASRSTTGVYVVSFPTKIDRCAAAVNSASFAGYDTSVYRVWAQVAIGYGQGGGIDPRSVVVNLFGSGLSSVDTSFTLVLAC